VTAIQLAFPTADKTFMKLTKVALMLGIAQLALVPAAAQANSFVIPKCPSLPAVATALAGFGDARSYFLAPGGDFETGAAGWTLSGAAGVVAGTGPLHAGSDASSLRLPAGAAAMSPAFCVDLTVPTFRFFASGPSATKGSRLTVDMIAANGSGQILETAKVEKFSTGWTLVKDIDLPLAGLVQVGGVRQVQLRFRATTGDWRVDDVLIDPRMRV
jgi:hypothetical protein